MAIDGSKHSERVVDSAAELAKTLSAKIILLDVIPEVPIAEENSWEVLDEPGRRPEGKKVAKPGGEGDYYERVAARVISEMKGRISMAGVEVEGIYEVGNPAASILDTAKERKVSLIVVGVHGLHYLDRIAGLGSTSRRVIENSTVPVVAVP